MPPLPPEALPVVPNFNWWIFDIAVPNLIVICLIVVALALAFWLKLPRWFEK